MGIFFGEDVQIDGEHTYHGGGFINWEGAASPGTGGDADWHEATGCTAADDLDDVTHSDCDLTATNATHYEINYSFSFIGHTNETYRSAISIGTPADLVPEMAIGCQDFVKILTGTNGGDLGGQCSANIPAGATVRVIIMSVGAGVTEMTVKTFDFHIHQV